MNGWRIGYGLCAALGSLSGGAASLEGVGLKNPFMAAVYAVLAIALAYGSGYCRSVTKKEENEE